MILFSLSCFTVFSIRLLSVCNYGREGLGDPITCDDVRQHQVECSHRGEGRGGHSIRCCYSGFVYPLFILTGLVLSIAVFTLSNEK